ALALGAAALACVVGLRTARRGATMAVVLAGTVVAIAVAGYWSQHNYLQHRYQFGNQIDRWARHLHGARIGMVGYPAQYPLLGLDLSNRVDYVGDRVAHGGIRTAKTCRHWRQLLDRAGYGYVVTGTNEWQLEQPRETQWTSG